MGQLLEYIKNIAFFLILMSVVSNVLPDNGYKKYCRLFCGLVLVVMVITPFYEFLNYDGSIEDIFISKSFALEKEQLEKQLIANEEGYEERIKQEYERLLLEELKGIATESGLSLSNVSVEVTGDEELVLNRVLLYITTDGDNAISNEDADIGKINIEDIQIGDSEKEDISNSLSPREIQLIKNTAKYLEISESKIKVINI